MRLKKAMLRLATLAAIAAAVVAAAVWWPRPAREEQAGTEIWTCSMHPQLRLPNPGQCPICGMKLIPVSQLPGAQEDLEKRAGLETEAVHHRELFKEIRTVGKLDYSERQVELITARIAGRVDRVFADFTGLDVKKGDHLVAVYSPELYVAQNELLISLEAYDREKQASPNARTFAESRLESSRKKLRLLGILEEQIEAIEKTRTPTTHLTIYSPLGGTVIEKNIRVGQYVAAGDQLYRIANLDPIWLYLNIYEFDLAWVRFGQPVEVALEAFAGETFHGTVTFVDPFLDDSTRTVRVRVNLRNPDRRLKAQMYATATIRVPLRGDGTPARTGLEGKFICPMHPEVVQAEPGKCSICEMALERVPDLPAIAKGPADHKADEKTSENVADTSYEETMSRAGLAIPVSAVLDTGRRRIAYRLTRDGAYELVELKLGPRAQSVDESGRERDFHLVLDGLSEGDKVVVQSGFLLDSQRQIEGMPSLLYPTGQAGSMTGHTGHGKQAAKGSGGGSVLPSSTGTIPSGHKH